MLITPVILKQLITDESVSVAVFDKSLAAPFAKVS